MDSREKLIDYLETHCIDSYGELKPWQVADFILKDRQRIVEPLVKVMAGRIDDNATYDAIQETLKLSGVQP